MLVVSAVLFGLMAVAARIVARHVPGPEVAMFRFAIGVIAVGFAVVLGKRLRPRRWGWLVARGVAGGMAVFIYFSSIEHIGVGIATLLNYTAPVWSLLLGWWLLDERPRVSAVAALALTLVGVVFVVAGDLRGMRTSLWHIGSVFSAIASGIAITSIRAVRRPTTDGQATESSWTVFASFTGLGLLATLPAVFGPLGRWVTPTPFDWVMILVVGILSVIAQLIMTEALEHLTGTTMGIIHQLTVVVAMTCGILFLGERLTVWSAVGSALTVAGVVWTALAAGQGRR